MPWPDRLSDGAHAELAAMVTYVATIAADKPYTCAYVRLYRCMHILLNVSVSGDSGTSDSKRLRTAYLHCHAERA